MSKKLMTACLALMAFTAFAVVPSFASAKPILTHPTGTILATGTAIELVSVGEAQVATPIGTLKCTVAKLGGTLTNNSTAGGFEADITSATFAGTGGPLIAGENECIGVFGNFTITPNPATNGLPWCLEGTGSTDAFELRGGSCLAASRPIRFTLDLTIGAQTLICNYEKSVPVQDTFATHPAEATAEFVNQLFSAVAGNPFGCPSRGELTMKFKIQTVGGGVMYISS
jgi:hypothetical protein